MLQVNSLFSNYKFEVKKGRRTEKGDLIDAFLEQLNPPRIETKRKPLTISYLNLLFKERKMTKEQIYCFYQDCKKARSFGAYFWHALKAKKDDKPK